MSVNLTITELRSDLYKVVDQIIASGTPVEVMRNGHKIKIILADGPSKFERLVRRKNVINGDPESIVHSDWFSEWSETKGKPE